MFIEKRTSKSSVKYYLVHSFRDSLGKTRKIRKFLGSNLSPAELTVQKKAATKEIENEIAKLLTKVFFFSLTEREKSKLNSYSERIAILHLGKEEWQRFTEQFVYNTNAIEGSQVQEDAIPKAMSQPNPRDSDELEAAGVKQAVNYIRTTRDDVSLQLLLTMHKLCFEKTKSFAGSFRNVNVIIRDGKGAIVHRGTRVEELQEALNDLVEWYKENKTNFAPLALAAIMHNQFEHIHPFQDGNGRVGRLLLNFILLKHKYPPINILFENRMQYYKTLQEYHKSQDLIPTMRFLTQQYKKTYKQVTTKRKKQ